MAGRQVVVRNGRVIEIVSGNLVFSRHGSEDDGFRFQLEIAGHKSPKRPTTDIDEALEGVNNIDMRMRIKQAMAMLRPFEYQLRDMFPGFNCDFLVGVRRRFMR